MDLNKEISNKVKRDALIYISHMKDDLMNAQVSSKKVSVCTCLVCEDWAADWEVYYETQVSVGYVKDMVYTGAIPDSDISLIYSLKSEIRNNDLEQLYADYGDPVIGRKMVMK